MSEVETNENGQTPNAPVAAPSKVMAIITIVLGVLGCNILTLGLGIASVVILGKVPEKASSGDAAGAADSTKLAKNLSVAGLVIWGISVVLGIIYNVVMFAGAAASSY